MASSLYITNSRPTTRDTNIQIPLFSQKTSVQTSESPRRDNAENKVSNGNDFEVPGLVTGLVKCLENEDFFMDSEHRKMNDTRMSLPESTTGSLASSDDLIGSGLQSCNVQTHTDEHDHENISSLTSFTSEEMQHVVNQTDGILHSRYTSGHCVVVPEASHNAGVLPKGQDSETHQVFRMSKTSHALRLHHRIESGATNVSSHLDYISPGVMGLDDDDENKRKKVGQYLLGGTIGEGSYAKVRVATHLISKQQVAIKVVSKRVLVHRDAARRRFRREALLLQKLSHPNIVKLNEVMETSNCYYLVYQLVSGGNMLSYVLQRGHLSEEEARGFLRQMISAVEHIHRSGIVHRDLKLENFLLDEKMNIKVVDLGLSSQCLYTDQVLRTQCGSPVYAAPELFAARKYGQAVDIWSLGVCMYAMLTGRLPFLPPDGSSLPQLYALILRGCHISENLSPACQDLIGQMLNIEASQRIPIGQILTHEWLTAPDGQPIKRQSPVSKKLSPNIIDWGIVRYMCTTYRFSENEVVNSVLERKLCAAAATYNILKDGVDSGTIIVPFNKTDFPRNNDHRNKPNEDPMNLPLLTRIKSKSARHSVFSKVSGSKDRGVRPKTQDNTRRERKDQSCNSSDDSLSYKKCLIGLKRTRQRLGMNSSMCSSRYVDTSGDRSLQNGHGDSQLPVLNHGNTLKEESTWKLDYTYRIRFHSSQSLNFDVKGTSPWTQQRNTSSSIGFSDVSSHQKQTKQFVLSTLKTPPPPPPNSSTDKTSSSLICARHAKHSAYQYRPTRPSHQPSQHSIIQSVSRPSLTALRDPFHTESRDFNRAASTGSHARPTNLKPTPEHAQQRPLVASSGSLTLYHKWNKSYFWDRGKSYVIFPDEDVTSCVKNTIQDDEYKKAAQDEETQFNTDGSNIQDEVVEEASAHDAEDEKVNVAPVTSRDETDSPLSQSHEREEFPMPVISVIINVRS